MSANRFKGVPYDNKRAGTIIRNLRRQRGLSQEVLSGLAGIARSHLSDIENGKKDVYVDTLWRIADALDVRLSEIIRSVEDEENYES